MKTWSRSMITLVMVAVAVLVAEAAILWVLRPTDLPPPQPPQTGYHADIAPEWLRWSSMVALAGTFAGLVGFGVMLNRRIDQERQALLEELRESPPKVITTGSQTPREPLAEMFSQLRRAGFRHLGRYECRFSLTGFVVAWVMVSRDGAVRAIGNMPDWAGLPSVLLTTQFADDALLETRVPRTIYDVKLRRKKYLATAHSTLEHGLAYHLSTLKQFEAAHGPAATIQTLDEHLRLGMRANEYGTLYFNSIRQGRYDTLIVMALFVMALLYYLAYIYDGANICCADLGLIFSLGIVGFGYLVWRRYQRLPR